MTAVMVLRGRKVSGAEIELIRVLQDKDPASERTPLSQKLCRCWNWRNAPGQLKDMAARTLLLKLERFGFIRLPPRRDPAPNGRRDRNVAPIAPPAELIRSALCELRLLRLSVVAAMDEAGLFHGLLGQTRGRTRNDRTHRIRAAIKNVYLYSLVADFQRELSA